MRKSPCCFCERKDYAGGCSIGCAEYAAYNAERDAYTADAIRKRASAELLKDGMMKSLKANRRRKR